MVLGGYSDLCFADLVVSLITYKLGCVCCLLRCIVVFVIFGWISELTVVDFELVVGAWRLKLICARCYLGWNFAWFYW